MLGWLHSSSSYAQACCADDYGCLAGHTSQKGIQYSKGCGHCRRGSCKELYVRSATPQTTVAVAFAAN